MIRFIRLWNDFSRMSMGIASPKILTRRLDKVPAMPYWKKDGTRESNRLLAL